VIVREQALAEQNGSDAQLPFRSVGVDEQQWW
jgi:hypothetical protein